MALRLVRQTSDTPNITNKDDTIMARYAYGGYNGVVKAFGNECNYKVESGIFTILDGRIVIDGWEIDIDGAGWSLDFTYAVGTQYHSIFATINVATETTNIDKVFSQSVYPQVNKGDDLTSVPNGTANLLLYNVRSENGTITEVIKKFEIIPYVKTLENSLKDGSFVVSKANNAKNANNSLNSYKINNLEIKQDENGVLKIGDITIPQWEKIYSAPTSTSEIYGARVCDTDQTITLTKMIAKNEMLFIRTKTYSGNQELMPVSGYFVAGKSALFKLHDEYDSTLKITIFENTLTYRVVEFLGGYVFDLYIDSVYKVIV